MPANDDDSTGRRWFERFQLTRRRVLQGSAGIGVSALAGRGAAETTATQKTQPNMARQTQEELTNGLRKVKQLPLGVAKKVADAAEKESRRIGIASVITITDPHGNLIVQRRMDNAWLPSVSISRQKAYTAAGFEAPTNAIDGDNGYGTVGSDTYETADPGEEDEADLPPPNGVLSTEPEGPLWGLHTTDNNQLVIFGGGYPLKEDGEVVGAIGASGGLVSQDEQVASAGVEKFNKLIS